MYKERTTSFPSISSSSHNVIDEEYFGAQTHAHLKNDDNNNNHQESETIQFNSIQFNSTLFHISEHIFSSSHNNKSKRRVFTVV
jgi:hypothetical protein